MMIGPTQYAEATGPQRPIEDRVVPEVSRRHRVATKQGRLRQTQEPALPMEVCAMQGTRTNVDPLDPDYGDGWVVPGLIPAEDGIADETLED